MPPAAGPGREFAPGGLDAVPVRSRSGRKPQLMVVAALIERGGRVLIGQRKQGHSHALKWEFPGGKVEPGESPKQALERELREELGIEAEIGPEIVRYEYRYPGRRPILLMFYLVNKFSGEPQNRVFERICWELPARLPQYDFVDGDFDFIRRLVRGEFARIVHSIRAPRSE